MPSELTSVTVFLSLLWFGIYWVLGGVFFAVITILRLGRIRKVRFSCLFSLFTSVVAVGTAIIGMRYSQEAVGECLLDAVNKAERVTAVFGCGFAGVFGTFLIGALILTIGGFFIMTISKSKSRPWIVINELDEGGPEPQVPDEPQDTTSKFF